MVTAILTDIEGTTSSLSFVKDVLFPYARDQLDQFIKANAENPEVAAQLDEVRRLTDRQLTLDEVIAQLHQWIDEDQKITPLKTLQGYIWRAGYADGAFKGHIYDDAVINMRRWHGAGLALYVFSSGSVEAQKLLFSHTKYGDLTQLFSGYFDTSIGSKRESDAYHRIAAGIGTPAEEILFLSDIVAELDAAKAAKMKTLLLARDGNAPTDCSHPWAQNFDQISLSEL